MGKKFISVTYVNNKGTSYTKEFLCPDYWVRVLGVSLYVKQPPKRISKIGKEAE